MITKTKQIILGSLLAASVAISGSIYTVDLYGKKIEGLKTENESLNSQVKEKDLGIQSKEVELNQLRDENNELNQRIEEMRVSSPVSRGGARGSDLGVVELTAYETGGYCANGMPAQPGVVAVDPNFIPLGSKIYIEVDGMPEYSGVYVAADTGGAVNGNIIDICMESGHWEFGRRSGRAWYVE